MFVRNLPYGCNEESVRGYFEKFGVVGSVRLPKDEENRCRGFSFVEFTDRNVYHKVIKMSHIFDNRKLTVEECLSSSKHNNTKRSRDENNSKGEDEGLDERKKFKGKGSGNNEKWQKKGNFNRSQESDRSSGRRDRSRQYDKPKRDDFKDGNTRNQKIVFEDNSD